MEFEDYSEKKDDYQTTLVRVILPIVIGVLGLAFVVLFVVYEVDLSLTATECLHREGGEDFFDFYVTFHQDIKNVYHYNNNGKLLGMVLGSTKHLKELRGMYIFHNNANLVIANAYHNDSKIVHAKRCGTERDGPQTLTRSHLSHPYGVAAGHNEGLGDHAILYCTNQNTNQITFYKMDKTNSSVTGGGFFGPDSYFEQLRGITVHPGTMEVIVADESLNEVLFLNSTGEVSMTISVSSPIGVYIADGVLYVSSNSQKHPAVYSYDLDTLELQQTFKSSELGHPCGISSCRDQLLVLSQESMSLLVFNTTTSEFLGTLIDSFGDIPEQVLTLNCPEKENEMTE